MFTSKYKTEFQGTQSFHERFNGFIFVTAKVNMNHNLKKVN
jgi:hypothetical protein